MTVDGVTNMELPVFTAVLAAAVATHTPDAGILTNAQLRAWVVIGAVGGGYIGTVFNTPDSIKQRAVMWITSTLTSLLASPYLIEVTQGPDPSHELVLFFAAAVGFVAWIFLGLIQSALPAIFEKIKKKWNISP